MSMSLDELIAHLTELRDSGVPGTTPVARYSYSSLLRFGAGQINKIAASKPDIESGRQLIRRVSRRGVDVIAIG